MHDEDRSTRRGMFGLALVGLSPALFRRRGRRAQPAPSGMACPTGSPLDVAGQEEKIVEEAYRLGYEYEKKHGGCAQCTLAALQDAVPFLARDEGLFRGASCLDGGATPTKLHNCGSFSAAAMAIGYFCGRRRGVTFEGTAKQSHKLIRKLFEQYDKRYGSVLCKVVREKADRDCLEVCGLAAKWTAQILLDELAATDSGA